MALSRWLTVAIMMNRQRLTMDDRLRAIELDPNFTWETLQLHLRNTDRKIRKLLAAAVTTRKRKLGASLQGAASRRRAIRVV
jgi:hypothetical protein